MRGWAVLWRTVDGKVEEQNKARERRSLLGSFVGSVFYRKTRRDRCPSASRPKSPPGPKSSVSFIQSQAVSWPFAASTMFESESELAIWKMKSHPSLFLSKILCSCIRVSPAGWVWEIVSNSGCDWGDLCEATPRMSIYIKNDQGRPRKKNYVSVQLAEDFFLVCKRK